MGFPPRYGEILEPPLSSAWRPEPEGGMTDSDYKDDDADLQRTGNCQSTDRACELFLRGNNELPGLRWERENMTGILQQRYSSVVFSRPSSPKIAPPNNMPTAMRATMSEPCNASMYSHPQQTQARESAIFAHPCS
jgi:hypothetical protein